jgi:putative tryptophan/tyrosine transport system substrate-binding protein
MRRRRFMILGGAVAATWSLAGRAQQSERVRRIGVLLPFDSADDLRVRQLWPAFKQRLDELGWVEGRNIQFDVHFTSQDVDRIRAGAAELVANAPEVLVVWSNPDLAALKRATPTIPIVFAQVGDPVGSGLVTNLARPGGNITGFQNFEPAMGGKWLELLKEIASGLRRVGVIYDRNIPANVELLRNAEAAAVFVGMTATATELHSAGDIEPALANLAEVPGSGLIVMPNPLNSKYIEVIVGLAARLHLPAIYPFHLDSEKGGLISYGFDTIEQQRGTATYDSRILKGENAGELPVQAPTKYELVINLKAAKALGLDVSPQLQQRADQVIE